ncbi:putative glycosyl transferase, family 2 [Thermacetogenium phaeum DSM 12270]|uniref:Putative glycosyl transferase, family 2 n=1 Tax=Thermacetogenium phaeum (strain ATCC BAA-254 / DSM 26808 / PB) TaxID=1089553 RepID=K4LFI3_THEPS|nr:glycosyltransferase [Thermacetogenium phaeum]AFV11623.1 putative glycosyl transferase, family 2 [Thermacetogenium phaeum DSM 12270]
MLLGIVIPVYNEEMRLLSMFRVIREELKGIDYVVIIADDGSSDGTVEVRTLIRALVSWGFASLARLLTGLPYRDFQCGCKAFTAEAAHALFLEPFRCGKFAFDVEVLLRARDVGFVVTEVPVLWRAGDGSKVRLLKHGLEMLKSLLALRAAYGRGGARARVALRPGGGGSRLHGADVP